MPHGDGWAIELRETNGDVEVAFDRLGGVVRVKGVFAVVRGPTGTVEQPIMLVMREGDAKGIATRLLGELCRFR